MRIGELARRTRLTVETLRFYERAGLLGAVTRDGSGYRVYGEQTYRTLVAVRWVQELGLRLEDIATVLATSDVPPEERVGTLQRTVDERLAALHDEIKEIEQKIASLEALRAVPFAGDCIMPGAFVDQLVVAHEATEHAKPPATRRGPKKPRREGASRR
jgi:DNA-binding transcriptional MerR regulator